MPSASATTHQPPLSTSQKTSPRPPPSLPNELLLHAESQWLFTEAELLSTPSILAGLSPRQERENRSKGVNFIIQVGIMLQLPQITLATASVFLHRFFMRHSMIDSKTTPPRPGCHYYSVAATCLFLATKVEENCRKMKELVCACVKVAQKNPSKVVDEQDKEYWRWRDTILQMEDLLLEATCFDLNLDPPYAPLFALLCFVREENNKRLRNAAWAFVNDSCLTMLCLLFPSRTIAAAALYAAARHCDVRFLDDEHNKPWWESVGVTLRDIRRACNYMAGVYEDTPLKTGGLSMYERTPEDGDEGVAKTRERRTESMEKDGMWGEGMSRRSSNQSGTGSVGSKSSGGSGKSKKKRMREQLGGAGEDDSEDEVVPDVPWGGETREEAEEREGKRRKVVREVNGTNGVGEEGKQGKADGREKKDDDASEEGEVEP